MSPNALNILNALDAGAVVRYHAAPRVRPQTVAEHSFGVAVIARCLQDAIDPSAETHTQDIPRTTELACSGRVVDMALGHDMPELWTGDIPFQVKRDSHAIRSSLELLEREAAGQLPEALGPYDYADEPNVFRVILKLADTLEGLRWTKLHELPDRDGVCVCNSRWQEAFRSMACNNWPNPPASWVPMLKLANELFQEFSVPHPQPL